MSLGMNKLFAKLTIVLVVLCFAATAVAAGPFAGRVLPKGKVSLYHGTDKVGEFTSEAPLPLNTLMVTEKRCAIKADSLFLVAEDGTAFSISERETLQQLRIEKGMIYFALSALPRSLVFQTPDAMVTAQAITLNASTQKNVLKGYVKATKEGSEIGIYEGGSILINTDQGEQTVSSGQRILLAQLPTDTKEKEKKKKGVGFLGIGGGGGATILGLSPEAALVGAGLTGGMILGARETFKDTGNGAASVAVPPQ